MLKRISLLMLLTPTTAAPVPSAVTSNLSRSTALNYLLVTNGSDTAKKAHARLLRIGDPDPDGFALSKWNLPASLTRSLKMRNL